jgi:hydrogenase maturation protease
MPDAGPTILVGGVSQLYQSDHDVGREVVDGLGDLAAPGVHVEDLSYGAIAVVHRLEELRPDVLILVGTHARGRPAGTVEPRRVAASELTPEELQGAVLDAGTGYVDLALTVDVIHALGVLPARTVVVEIEPAETGPGEGLSDAVRDAVAPAAALIRREVATVRGHVPG